MWECEFRSFSVCKNHNEMKYTQKHQLAMSSLMFSALTPFAFAHVRDFALDLGGSISSCATGRERALVSHVLPMREIICGGADVL